MTLKVGQHAPDFTLSSHNGKEITLRDFRGKNVVLAYFPMAWTPVCTNQIPSYEERLTEFEQESTQVFGISIDHVPCLKAWADSLGGITFPILSDFWPHGQVAEQYGVLRKNGTTERAIFVIDKDGIIRDIDIHDIDDQPDNEELFSVLRQINGKSAVSSGTVLKEDKELPKDGIVMYCTRWCPDCRKARDWFEANQIDYHEVNINMDHQAAAYVRNLNGGVLVTPTFEINGKYVFDFDQKKLESILL
jgi:peroxiredoxin (alkyl hydroperoxide reductase subunit C)